jgi:diguanylate cyclase (GGDEF)-like protein/PAS domain S-box-containing protein
MNNKDLTLSHVSIRAKAEMIAESQKSDQPDVISPERAQFILQELQVHQIELQMQNEELLRSHEALAESKERYFDLYELAPIGYLTLNKEGKILEANLTATTLFAIPRGSLINTPLNTFIVSQDQDIFYHHTLEVLNSASKKSCELRFVRGNEMFWALLDSSISKNSAGGITLHVVLHDITARKKAESDLAISAIAFESQNGIIITDTKGIILRTNQAFARITGFNSEESIGKTLSLLKSGRHNKQFYETMWSVLKTEGFWQGEIWNKRKNGEIYAEFLSITAVRDDGTGPITHYVGNFSDITHHKESEAAIHRLAYYDALTGLPNRRLFQDRVNQAVCASARSKVYGAVLFIDIDHFKTLNDTRGHSVGDLLLIDMAQRLQANIRQSDTVGRQGGDEFVILLDNLSHEMSEAATMAQHLAEKLHKAIQKPFNLNGTKYSCKISIGISLLTEDDTVEDLLRQADLALYKAKEAGRNTLRFFDPTMQEALILRTALESELNSAILQEEFRLYYQPQVNLKGQVRSVEALIRWQHPQRGLISPDYFIPLAEETDLILTIGKWVMETACSQLKQWEKHRSTSTLKIAVNVSAREFRQTDYVAQVERIIKASGINPLFLKLELTESIVVENMNDTIEKMNALKEFGVTFSMDDFGTGFSSLSNLAQLPLSQLKIDKSFVDNIPGTKNDEMITRTIITMGKELEMHVIAEGVETQAQREFLEANGCTSYQGYLYSRPLPIEKLEELLNHEQQ